MTAKEQIKYIADEKLDGRRATVIVLNDGFVFNKTNNDRMVAFSKEETGRWLNEPVSRKDV